jgi:hypothetical protein
MARRKARRGDTPNFGERNRAQGRTRCHRTLSSVVSVRGRPRVYLIMHANTIRGELRFRIKRNDPDGRTRLDEILASGIATVFAPPFLIEEVEKHLPKWFRQLKIRSTI